MPPSPLADLYALALRTLDAHERRASELRARVTPVLAAGGLGITLLAQAGFAAAAARPLALAAVGMALTGLVAALRAAAGLLLSRPPVLDVGADQLVRRLERDGALDDHDAYAKEMIELFASRAAQLEHDFDVHHHDFTVIMGGTLVMLCGLALAALVG